MGKDHEKVMYAQHNAPDENQSREDDLGNDEEEVFTSSGAQMNTQESDATTLSGGSQIQVSGMHKISISYF
jgi:hypothetical protein